MIPAYRNHGCRLALYNSNGQQLLFLENELLRVGVLVDKGADIIQFLHKPSDTEFMLHVPDGIRPPAVQSTASAWGTFLDSYPGGWQEILPNGGPACTYKGIEFGLHGEISTIPWQLQIDRDSPQEIAVTLTVRPYRTPFLLEREMVLRLGEAVLTMNETLTNLGGETMDYMWGHHPAFGAPFLGPDCVVDLPAPAAGAEALTLETFEGAAGTRLAGGSRHAWPYAREDDGPAIDFSRPDPYGSGQEDLGYVVDLPQGWYAITNQARRVGFALTWPVDVKPYLWVWRQFNVSCGYPWYGRVYTMGLEPWTSYPSAGLRAAIDNGSSAQIEPGHAVQATLRAIAYQGLERVTWVTAEGRVTWNPVWLAYVQASEPVPDQMLAWPFFGAGFQNLGVSGQPVLEPVPDCGPEDLLVRVDALGLCNSDLKMVHIGSEYPLFFERDFEQDPGRLGHEIAVTVIEVGERWRGMYHRGQRLGMQPDVRHKGLRLCLGVNLLGGMSQYVTLGPEAVGGDPVSYIFPAAPEVTYVDLSLLEPWACVDAAYQPVRRLEPQKGGVMWIKGRPDDDRPYIMSRPLDCARLVLTDVPGCLKTWVRAQDVEVWERDGATGPELSLSATGGAGFDDIVLLDPRQASTVEEAVEVLVPFGCLNLVTGEPLDAAVRVDIGRLHYEHLAFVGCPGPDIASAYGPDRNRSDLRPGGVALIVGAGGTMGRMNLIRTLEMPHGPQAVIVTNRGAARLEALVEDFGPLARERGIELVAISPTLEPGRLEREIDRLTGGRGCDDVIVIVPNAEVVAESVPYLAHDGMLVVFAGVRGRHKVPVPLDRTALYRAQVTGTSGSSIEDAKRVMEKARTGELSPSRAVAAIGGLKTISQAMQAMMDAIYPGKIIIFPNLLELPLMSLGELETTNSEVYRLLGPGETWTAAAEQALFEAHL